MLSLIIEIVIFLIAALIIMLGVWAFVGFLGVAVFNKIGTLLRSWDERLSLKN